MRRSAKPVHECYACLLNLGDDCWLYRYPRGQWRGRRCSARDDAEIHERFLVWQKQPSVKTRRDLRREVFRRRRKHAHRDPLKGRH